MHSARAKQPLKRPAVGDKIEMFKLGVVTVEALRPRGAFVGSFIDPDGLERRQMIFEPKAETVPRSWFRRGSEARLRGRARKQRRGWR